MKKLLLILFLFACTVDRVEIDTELQQYVDIYKYEVAQRRAVDLSSNLTKVVVWDLADSINGLGRKGEVIINRKILDDPLQVEATFMHEIGHALYGLHHDDCRDVALMCLPDDWIYHKYKETLLDQLILSHDQGAN